MTFSAMGVGMFAGIRIVEDSRLTVETQDWSGVRSPSRARRRLRRGFRQNIVYGRKPDPKAYSINGGKTLIMHPATYDAVKRAAGGRSDARTLISPMSGGTRSNRIARTSGSAIATLDEKSIADAATASEPSSKGAPTKFPLTPPHVKIRNKCTVENCI